MKLQFANQLIIAILATSAFAIPACSGGCLGKGTVEEKKEAFERKAKTAEEKPPELINVADFASNEASRKAVFALSANQIVRRMGDHEFSYASKLAFKGVKDKKFSIEDRTKIVVSGPRDFYLVRETGKGKGVEIWIVDGVVYTGDKGGPYSRRPQDGSFARRFKNATYDALNSMIAMLGPDIKFTPKGSQEVNGLTAYRFGIELGAAAKPPEKPEFPNTPEGKEAESEAAQMENDNTPYGLEHFTEKSKPVEVKGDLWIQDGTGVIVKSSISGKTMVGTNFAVELDFSFESEMDTKKKIPTIVAPEVVPPPRAEKIPSDPLEFYKKTEVMPEQRELKAKDKPEEKTP